MTLEQRDSEEEEGNCAQVSLRWYLVCPNKKEWNYNPALLPVVET